MAEEPPTHTSTSQQSSSKISSEDPPKHQGPALCGPGALPNGVQMFPIMYPALVPGLYNSQNQEQMNRGAGIYAVPVLSFMGPVAGFQPNALVPLTYSIPTTRPSSSEATTVVDEQGHAGQQQQQHQHQHPAPQRQVVVRRFQIAIQLDLLLILKLAAVIFLFNQDGSRQRLVLLVFFASLVYLYQTGALAPLIRWLSQGMPRAAAPPQPPRPAARAENVPPAARQGNENAAGAEGHAENENQPLIDINQAAVENENENENEHEHEHEHEHVVEPDGGNRWWGIVKEIQMIVFGFITSLLPGFHNMD
ncbi:uncharacterized protein LOC114281481 [Camellia sinensis]|uniref:Transmembrane protein n=1 Tax=Camellia sinensis var. sinensis TaxID=542762 RepID=A0A4S4E1G9_CAMSN|nr:uncharacterized protein LOC114281481 [Camellia sinensis]THG09661.1 hypothetical protein TEA_014605 [Camellia sinensis var. sinensis]